MSTDNVFVEQIEQQVVDMYSRAFSGFPWYEDLSTEAVKRRLAVQASLVGFTRIIEYDEEQRAIGAIWYDTPSLDDLERERGSMLRQFAAASLLKQDRLTLVWEREVLVDPNSQGQGLGARLRKDMFKSIQRQFPDGALLLTRMRDDNTPIIRIAEKLNYRRTGIRTPSSSDQSIYHEFWYRLFGASNEQ